MFSDASEAQVSLMPDNADEEEAEPSERMLLFTGRSSVVQCGSVQGPGCIGMSVNLNKEGYEKVLSGPPGCITQDLRDFVTRLIVQEELCVQNKDSLKTFLPYFGPTCSKRSFAELLGNLRTVSSKPELCGGKWLRAAGTCTEDKPTSTVAVLQQQVRHLGKTDISHQAQLSEMGYLNVAGTFSIAKMARFIRRIIDSLNMTLLSEESLLAFAPYYTQPCGVQSYKKLKGELWDIALNRNPECGGSWLQAPSAL